MKMPGFTAEASTYRTGRHYIGRPSNAAGSSSREGVMPAYRPGSETRSRCQSCLDGCTSSDEVCIADAWSIMLGCIFPLTARPPQRRQVKRWHRAAWRA